MLNVLHGRFVANPAQNSPSHIMKGKKAQMSTVSHWDWIRHPHLTLLIHTRPRSPFLSLSPPSTPLAQKPPAHKHTPSHSKSCIQHEELLYEYTNIHLPPSPCLWYFPTEGLVNLKYWFEGKGQRAAEVYTWNRSTQSSKRLTAVTPFLKISHTWGTWHRDVRRVLTVWEDVDPASSLKRFSCVTRSLAIAWGRPLCCGETLCTRVQFSHAMWLREKQRRAWNTGTNQNTGHGTSILI